MNSLRVQHAPQQPSVTKKAFHIHWIGECSVPISAREFAAFCWAPEYAHKLKALREESSHCNLEQQMRVLR